VHLKPYESAIAAGVGTIMPSFSSWNGTKCSADKYLLTEVLKEEMGFEGFLISDYNAIDQLSENYKDAIALSVNAGMDMFMVPSKYKDFYQGLHELVEDGRVPMSRIDDAVTRILRVKIALGLLDKDRPHLSDGYLDKTLGATAHRAVAREAVRKSLVLLKNDNQALPLSKGLSKIHVAGLSADDMGRQCGGWTITWQGKSGDVVEGTTILEAIRDTVSDETAVSYSADGSGGEGADAAIVVIGEPPYAEGQGDSSTLALTKEDVDTVKRIRELDVPTVVVLVSGRPLIIHDVLERSDAVLAAWLPGTEGQGVADVLFGDCSPSGRLSFTWPKSVKQLPLEGEQRASSPLFEFGHGLTYSD
jgi:beta-glucosidase